jgi:hypothetical protein
MSTSFADGALPPRPDGTPADVVITTEARRPVMDPTLGVPVASPARPLAQHRLVTVGDSITHGFQSMAISKTNLSWPAIVAHQLGLTPELGGPPNADFRFPTYDGYGGLPFNLEWCIRGLQERFGRLALDDAPAAVVSLIHLAYDIKHWWTHEADQTWAPGPGLNHNLAVYSYDVASAYNRKLADIESAIAHPGLLPRLSPTTANDVDRAARRVLANADSYMSLMDAAEAHGNHGGIDTLVVALGANNVLDVVVGLKYLWATGDATRQHGHAWSPSFFAADWEPLVGKLRQIKANRVLVATVPHVTVVPILAAKGERLRPDSRYFDYYTHYWLRDSFDAETDPHLTGDQARAIDSAIDQYNGSIVESVRAAREDGLDWYVLEMSGLLDRLAWRRYLSNPASRPSWWDEVGGAYPLPAPIGGLDPTPDTQFFEAGAAGRSHGGLIALDGVHPTTIGYGILAQEVINLMETAGVTFPGGTDIDFAALLDQDSLVSDPPATLTGDMHIVGWLNKHIDIISALLGR